MITVAVSDQEFESKVRRRCEELMLFVNEIEDLEPFAERVSKYEVDDELIELSMRAENRPDDVFFGAFHTYSRDGA